MSTNPTRPEDSAEQLRAFPMAPANVDTRGHGDFRDQARELLTSLAWRVRSGDVHPTAVAAALVDGSAPTGPDDTTPYVVEDFARYIAMQALGMVARSQSVTHGWADELDKPVTNWGQWVDAYLARASTDGLALALDAAQDRARDLLASTNPTRG